MDSGTTYSMIDGLVCLVSLESAGLTCADYTVLGPMPRRACYRYVKLLELRILHRITDTGEHYEGFIFFSELVVKNITPYSVP